jgi:two-component SAPR family response regulator
VTTTPNPGPAIAAAQALRLALRMVLRDHPAAGRAVTVYKAAYARYKASEWAQYERERLEASRRPED